MSASGSARAPLTHRRIFRIAAPIVLSNATVPLLGAVDTGVVGQMGQAAPIGAVGVGAVVLSTIYWIFGFLRMGTTGLTAQAHGAGDSAETGALLMRGLAIGAAGGCLLILLRPLLFGGAFLISPASAEVELLAQSYMSIRLWGAPAAIAIYAATGWLIALERTMGVLILQLWMNGLNVLLDIVFVLGFGWGVEGVALATLIAEWSGLALGVWLCRGAFVGHRRHGWMRIFDPTRLKRMMIVNADIMVRSILLTLAFTSFMFMGSGLGDVTLAANQILLQFLSITAFALDGFAFAAEALVGAAVGAHARAALRRAAIMTAQWAGGGAVLLGIVFLAVGPLLIDLMSTSPDVRTAARTYLFWAVLAPVIGVASWMFDGIYIGATWTAEMRRAMMLSVAVYAVAAAVLLPTFGNHGLWGALMILNGTRGLTLGWSYPRLEARVGRA